MSGSREEAELTRALRLWNSLSAKEFPNGVIMFCSEDISEVLHPVDSIVKADIVCGEKFHTSLVHEMISRRRDRSYGVILIDGDEATLGVWQAAASKVCKLAHLSSNIASRTRRGGQSAARYSRNRDVEEKAFLRKVAESVNAMMGDLSGFVVGGRADMKHKLVSELSAALRERVVDVVNLHSPANVETLQAMSAHLRSIAEQRLVASTADSASTFLEMLAREDLHVCYGEVETKKALQMRVVEELIVSSNMRAGDIRMWKQSATASGASFVEVQPISSSNIRFCEGIKVGAIMRYAVDPALLEVEEDGVLDADALDDGKYASAHGDLLVALPEDDSASTVPSETDTRFHDWLVEALSLDIISAASVDALVVCTEVILFDDALPSDERVQNVMDLLRAEGVREEVLLELSLHASDMLPLN